jgi:GTPase
MAKFGSGPHDTCGHLGQEVERGNVEYKLQLVGISGQRRLHLVTQLNWRLHEGGGRAFYEIGVTDSGEPIGISTQDIEESIQTLCSMADALQAEAKVLHRRKGTGKEGFQVVEVTVVRDQAKKQDTSCPEVTNQEKSPLYQLLTAFKCQICQAD